MKGSSGREVTITIKGGGGERKEKIPCNCTLQNIRNSKMRHTPMESTRHNSENWMHGCLWRTSG